MILTILRHDDVISRFSIVRLSPHQNAGLSFLPEMGQFLSQVQQPLGAARDSVSGLVAKKRKRSSSDSEELNQVLDATMRSPKK